MTVSDTETNLDIAEETHSTSQPREAQLTQGGKTITTHGKRISEVALREHNVNSVGNYTVLLDLSIILQ